MTVAALFVETGGCYFGIPDVDPWDVRRDARHYHYAGPHPVVAHPPCQRWGRFSTGSPLKKTYLLGDDEGCFIAALFAVENWGGVLEHPAYSKAWRAFGMAKPPTEGGWVPCRVGLTCHVEQGHYGHAARKPTWLYAKGVLTPSLKWGPSAQRLPKRRLAERGYESARRCGVVANMCSAHRQRTPVEFRDLLLSIARQPAR